MLHALLFIKIPRNSQLTNKLELKFGFSWFFLQRCECVINWKTICCFVWLKISIVTMTIWNIPSVNKVCVYAQSQLWALWPLKIVSKQLMCEWVCVRPVWNSQKDSLVGLPCRLSGKVSTCPCRRYRFDLWSRNIPRHKVTKPKCQLLSLALEPGNSSYWSPQALETVLHKRSHCNEKPTHHT